MTERVPMLDPDDAVAAGADAGVHEVFARLNIFRTLLHHPDVAGAVQTLLATLLGGRLDARLRELIILRLGWATRSEYEWSQHWRVARFVGLTDAEIVAVRDWHDAPTGVFGEADRAVLAAVDETLADGTVGEETWARLSRHLPFDAERIEVVAAIGTWVMISSVVRSLAVPLDADLEPWAPDGVTPSDVRNQRSEA